MDAVDFLNSDVVDLPKTRTTEDFLDYARATLDAYRHLMETVPPSPLINDVIRSRRELVRDVSNALITCLEHYFRGHPSEAFRQLDDALTILGPHFDRLCPSSDMSTFVNPMYRFRRRESVPFAARNLFHIPFELRHLVGSMRYSIPGLPALYLGGSAYVCWLELDKPDLDQVAVSRYEAVANSNLKVLNFGQRPAFLAAWIHNEPQSFETHGGGTAFVESFVACWPLIALCSIKKIRPTAGFHAEYIIPQLVLQWITTRRKFHGIRYFSTHYTDYHDNPKTYMNYVFPARTLEPTGLCPDLCGLFRLTDPMLWDDAKTQTRTSTARPQYKFHGSLLQELEDEFGHVESVLLGKPVVAVS